MDVIVCILFAYILGAVPFSFLIGKFCAKTDLRETGSGNVGATNLYRVCGFKYAAFGFLMDFAKGLIALYFVNTFFKPNEMAIIISGISVILGHVFPVFLKFKGGKGVSTAAGVLFYLDYRIFLIVFAFFWLVYFMKKIISLASVSAATLLFFLSIVFYKLGFTGFERAVFFGITAVLIVVFHRENIKRLIEKKEKRIDER